ncbi:homoprotocatechuate degradation operon regulator HpaR [Maliponia aquimaris]|uniref:Multidrug resistance operon repressor n=1 Tax=Maliponia aquimaris TaxID=1673631 RepID=A0A238KKA8_9RHOB|nr:homoprotocatechuate degradation operon regulator HpaR [Maliponia aquimaris]SMX43144.1 Multidrug resistance operon repressor [Maliponia aquimaris]
MTEPMDNDTPLSATQRTLPIALLRAREAVMEHYRPMLRAIDVTEQQWRVLRVIREADEIDATQLARLACVLAPSLTRILKALEARGLIAQTRDPADRRRSRVTLTEAGLGLLHNAAHDSARIAAGIEARLGADRLAALLDTLDLVIADLSADR